MQELWNGLAVLVATLVIAAIFLPEAAVRLSTYLKAHGVGWRNFTRVELGTFRRARIAYVRGWRSVRRPRPVARAKAKPLLRRAS